MESSIAPPVTKEKVLEENRRVHALENRLYLFRHPEQTNFFQNSILKKTVGEACVNLKPGAKILDLGCGTGYLSLGFLSKGYHVTGLDLSQEMIQAFEESIPAPLKPQARLIVGDAEEFLLQNQDEYDVIVLSAILHHFFDYESAGVYDYVCEPHAAVGMQGEITVQDVEQVVVEDEPEVEASTSEGLPVTSILVGTGLLLAIGASWFVAIKRRSV